VNGRNRNKGPMETIQITIDEAKRILEWRALIDPKNEEKHWSEPDSALMDKLLDFVDD